MSFVLLAVLACNTDEPRAATGAQHALTDDAEALEAPQPPAAQDDGATDCGQPAVPALAGVSFVAEGADVEAFDLPTRRGESIDLRLLNNSHTDGTISVIAQSRSEAGETMTRVVAAAVPQDSEEVVAVDPATLGLPDGAFEHSGSLLLTAELILPDGSPLWSEPLELFFHPTDVGWEIYDEAERDASHNYGVLGPDAAERLRAIVDVADAVHPGAVLLGVGRATLSEEANWPPSDGPADGEAEHQEVEP